MRLILGVNLTDGWYRFALCLLVSIQAGQPHTASWQAISSLQCLGVSRTVPRLLALLMMVEQPLLHPKVHNHPAHSTLPSSNPAALLPLALEKANHGAQIFCLSQHCVFVSPSIDLLGCLRQYTLPILHEQEEITEWL